MPYKKLTEANIKNIDGVPLTLAQANLIAAWADKIGGDKAWPFAIASFRKTHHIKDGKWVADEAASTATVTKEADGRYKIIAVSTAALPDREKETFTTQSMDYEIKMAGLTGEYPEFRLFHRTPLGIGRVEKMSRVGIFAVDEGHSYDDAFSKEICEKMLINNPGKWRVSRGFYVLEAKGGCPKCGEQLVIATKHILAGFRCPTCKNIHLSYKGVLKDVHFLRTKTFDVTVTDHPCNLYTGVVAFKPETATEDNSMTKQQLKEKLLAAGISEEVIDTKLATVSDAALKEYDDVPDATLLKEFQAQGQEETPTPPAETTEEVPVDVTTDKEAPTEPQGEVFILDPETLKEFATVTKEVVQELVTSTVEEHINVLKTEIKEMLAGLTIEVPESEIKMDLKELPELVAIKESLATIQTTLAKLTQTDAEKIAQVQKEMPRQAVLRVQRFKATPKAADGEDEDEEETEECMPNPAKGKKLPMAETKEGIIMDQEGKTHGSMTDFIIGK